ncbi:hypothetical protein HDV05_001310 [Chytridiales sp. JEL 0842]|nr:hypothetical protein HDV05_001310 [Chytridiales sp. JEL 0842]
MAACHLKNSNWQRAIGACDKVLAKSENNAKALFRRGQAYLQLNKLDKAEADLRKSVEADPKDPAPRAELAKIKQLKQERDEKAKKEWTGFLDRANKFTVKESVTGNSLIKSSQQRAIRAKILEQYPALEEHFEEIIPKKAPIVILKCQDAINIVTVNNVMLFFNHFDGPFYPTLKLLHKYPDILPKFQVDRGAIKFVIAGAHIMCPGLTSKGAKLQEDVPAETIVAIMAEGKEHALGLGLTKLSAADIKSINKGVGVENMHSIYDGLYKALFE